MAVLNVRDLDDELVRRVKAWAAMQGLKLKEAVAVLLAKALEEAEK